MKKHLILALFFICSNAFADYSYKVTEFKRVKDSQGVLISGYMGVLAVNGTNKYELLRPLKGNEIVEYIKDSAYEKTIAERIAGEAKVELDRITAEKTNVPEVDTKTKLDAIVIDPIKVVVPEAIAEEVVK